MAGGRSRSNADAGSDITKMSQGNCDWDEANNPVSASLLAAIKSAINNLIGERLDSALMQLVQPNQCIVYRRYTS